MPHVISADGTRIAYERSGAGETVIVVDGAIGSRALGFSRRLGELLAHHFKVIVYDRRGRGESGDTLPYAVEREVEDIEALIAENGGTAALYGISSGAALALEAAVGLGARVSSIALYEPPFSNQDVDLWRAYERELGELLAADRRGDAVALFMTFVGAPPEQIAPMRETPLWPLFEASAPTLAYDAAILGEERAVPTALAARLRVPALVMNGSASFPFMRDTARILAGSMPAGRYRELPGQRHDVDAEAIAPVLIEFFRRDQAAKRGQTRSAA
jgi:pimeloyl-ACP methyl ester carboxylesterase